MKNLLTKTLFILSLSSAVTPSGVQAGFSIAKVLKVGLGAVVGGLAATGAGVVAGVEGGVLPGKLGTVAGAVVAAVKVEEAGGVGEIIGAAAVAGIVVGAALADCLPPRELVVAKSEVPVGLLITNSNEGAGAIPLNKVLKDKTMPLRTPAALWVLCGALAGYEVPVKGLTKEVRMIISVVGALGVVMIERVLIARFC